MNVKHLIDSIMQQTTVLIGQLSTAAGVRAPLAHVADQVFVELAKELDSQGVGRRVAADMFGLALRSYQKKLRRLTESKTAADRTLWQAVLEYVRERGRARRADILARFRRDGEKEVGAVLTDLVATGLVYQTGRGGDALYGMTSEADLRHLVQDDDVESAAPLVWATVHDNPGTTLAKLMARLRLGTEVVAAAVRLLIADGKLSGNVDDENAPLEAVDLIVPVGAEHGWEVAVFDHFRAVANAIASKVRTGQLRSEYADVVGGATLSFDLCRDHPFEGRALRLLADVREQVNALWDQVEAHNAEHPIVESERRRLFFYFGQYLEENDDNSSQRSEAS